MGNWIEKENLVAFMPNFMRIHKLLLIEVYVARCPWKQFHDVYTVPLDLSYTDSDVFHFDSF